MLQIPEDGVDAPPTVDQHLVLDGDYRTQQVPFLLAEHSNHLGLPLFCGIKTPP